MFYDKFDYLCKKKGVSCSKAAIDAGISKSLVTKWKSNGTKMPSADVLEKLSKYFSVPISELIDENEQNENPLDRLEPTEREKRILGALRSKSLEEQKAFLTLLGIFED